MKGSVGKCSVVEWNEEKLCEVNLGEGKCSEVK